MKGTKESWEQCALVFTGARDGHCQFLRCLNVLWLVSLWLQKRLVCLSER